MSSFWGGGNREPFNLSKTGSDNTDPAIEYGFGGNTKSAVVDGEKPEATGVQVISPDDDAGQEVPIETQYADAEGNADKNTVEDAIPAEAANKDDSADEQFPLPETNVIEPATADAPLAAPANNVDSSLLEMARNDTLPEAPRPLERLYSSENNPDLLNLSNLEAKVQQLIDELRQKAEAEKAQIDRDTDGKIAEINNAAEQAKAGVEAINRLAA